MQFSKFTIFFFRIILTILGAFVDLKAGIWGRIIEGIGAFNDRVMDRLAG